MRARQVAPVTPTFDSVFRLQVVIQPTFAVKDVRQRL